MATKSIWPSSLKVICWGEARLSSQAVAVWATGSTPEVLRQVPPGASRSPGKQGDRVIVAGFPALTPKANAGAVAHGFRAGGGYRFRRRFAPSVATQGRPLRRADDRDVGQNRMTPSQSPVASVW